MHKPIYRPVNPDPMMEWIYENLIPEAFNPNDVSPLRELIHKHEMDISGIQAKLDSIYEYAKTCRVGIDNEQVRKLLNAKKSRKIACSILANLIKNTQAKEKLDSLPGIKQLQDRVTKLEKDRESLKQTNMRISWMNDRMERMILMLTEGDSADVKAMLWYWANKPDFTGHQTFKEYTAYTEGQDELAKKFS